MVQLKGDKVVTEAEPVANDLLGLATSKSVPKSPAKARAHFSVPGHLSPEAQNFKPPEYRSILGRKRIGLDIEGFDPGLDELGPGVRRPEDGGKVVGVALAYAINDASYYPTAHENGPNVEDPDKFYARLADEAKTFDGEIVGTNLQYDLDWLAGRHNVRFPLAKFRDVQIAEPLLDENRLTYKLNVLVKDYLGKHKSDEKLVENYGHGYIENMHKVHSGDAAVYARDDTTLPWELFDAQSKRLEAEELTDLFHLESDLFPLLLRMKEVGVRIALEKAQQSFDALTSEERDVCARINELAKCQIDIWAPESIAVAWKNMGLDYPTTRTGKPSFTKGFLQSSDIELAKLIVKARSNNKIANTFIKSYILESHINGRLHCSFNQLKSDEYGTVSGRFSSSGPNLQNIPARDPILGPLMRSMFLPEEGMLWGSLDWSQIEYRLLVHYAAITKGIDAASAVKAYRSDPKTDFHSLAAEITGVERKAAKNINFGVVYGMGVNKLAGDLGIPLDEAKAMMKQFNDLAPFMRGMLDRCSNAAARRGFIKTILGRKRRWDVWEYSVWDAEEEEIVQRYINDQGRDEFEKEFEKIIRGRPRRAATHKALNALLQGSAADLMKKAMVDAWEAGIFDVLIPHLTVHDEFNSSVPDTTEGREAFEELRHLMEVAIPLEIPVLADGTLGHNWDEAK